MAKKDKVPLPDSKKRKHKADAATAKAESAAAAASGSSGGFSLFGGGKDTDLNNLFSKSASFAREPVVPIASSSKAVVAPVEPVEAAEPATKKARKEKKEKKAKGKAVEVVAEVEAEAEDGDVEMEAESEVVEKDEGGDAEADSDAESDSSADLVHESLKSPSAKKKRENAGQTQKYTPADETQADRDRRTVFVGNLAIETAKSKSALSQLRAHLITFAPTAKIESVRFRSVALAAPTAPLPGDGEDEKEGAKRARREKERAAAWRESQLDPTSAVGGAGNRRGDDEVADKSKSFLDTKGKRKVAFIKKEFHEEASSCNAYVVFAHPHPDRPKNVAPILDPFEAVEKVLSANGSTFMERTIRVDRVRLPSSVGLATAVTALSKRDAWLPSGTDPKKSLFVGGLDYAAKDEDVRAFFETLVVAERGQPGEHGHPHWVTDVRIVRDKDTQMGKGFGYVHLIDRESADELIALPSTKLKFAKRPVRVQPCKTLPPNARSRAAASASSAPATATGKGKDAAGGPKKRAAPTGPIPRGNPKLGEKIKDLSKEERKVVKATDADRQARRMAKKQAKVAAAHRETGAVSLAATKADKKRTAKNIKAKGGRKRSENALAKMKGQRS